MVDLANPDDPSQKKKKYARPMVISTKLEDLSPRMRAEAESLLSERGRREHMKAESSPDHRILLTLEGGLKEVSDEFCRLLGYERSELLGKPIDAVTASQTTGIPKHLGTVFHFGSFEGLWLFAHKNGRKILVRCRWELLPDSSIEIRSELIERIGPE
jgi:PAS domain S-box-containing protein